MDKMKVNERLRKMPDKLFFDESNKKAGDLVDKLMNNEMDINRKL